MGLKGEIDGEQLEALPDPSLRPSRSRGGGAHLRSPPRTPTVSALETTHTHTAELQEALSLSSHLLTRPSLRKLIVRILAQDLGPQLEATLSDGAADAADGAADAADGAADGHGGGAGDAAEY